MLSQCNGIVYNFIFNGRVGEERHPSPNTKEGNLTSPNGAGLDALYCLVDIGIWLHISSDEEAVSPHSDYSVMNGEPFTRVCGLKKNVLY